MYRIAVHSNINIRNILSNRNEQNNIKFKLADILNDLVGDFEILTQCWHYINQPRQIVSMIQLQIQPKS